jgi:hypothetical protein
MKLIQTVKIKLKTVNNETYKEDLYWLACCANALIEVKNKAMRDMIAYLQAQIN